MNLVLVLLLMICVASLFPFLFSVCLSFILVGSGYVVILIVLSFRWGLLLIYRSVRSLAFFLSNWFIRVILSNIRVLYRKSG